MTREDIWSILRSNLAKIFSESPCISVPLSSDTSPRPLGTLHKARGTGQPALGVCCLPWSPHLLNSNASILVHTFLWLHELCCRGVGWSVLYCQQSKQLPWAHCLHALSLGSPFSLEWFFWGPAMSPQVTETFWPLFNKGLH